MTQLFEDEPLLIDTNFNHVIWTHDLQNEHKKNDDEENEDDMMVIKVEGANLVPALGRRKWDGHIYISGATGAGKSTLIRNIVDNDKLKRLSILFTNTSHDPAFDGMKYVRYGKNDPKYNGNWVNQNMDNKIMIFDDITGNEDFEWFRDKMLEEGRKKGICVICVNHKLQDYYKTKVALTDCRFVIAFPNTNSGAISKFMKTHLELPNKNIKKIINTIRNEGRHLVIHRFSPMFVSGARSIFKV